FSLFSSPPPTPPPLLIHHSPFTIHHSNSPLTIPNSPFTIRAQPPPLGAKRRKRRQHPCWRLMQPLSLRRLVIRWLAFRPPCGGVGMRKPTRQGPEAPHKSTVPGPVAWRNPPHIRYTRCQ